MIHFVKSVLEHTTRVIIDYLMHLPDYFFQGLGIWWWDHKTCPGKGFNHTTEGLKLPVFIISIGLQGQSLSTLHHFL